jgi:PAS domain S-box-containing protein
MNDLTNCEFEPLWEDGEFMNARIRTSNGHPSQLLVAPAREHPSEPTLAKIANAYALRSELETAWAAAPVELVRFRGLPALLVAEPSGVFLHQAIDGPMSIPDFLRLSIGIAVTLGELHSRGLVHKDVKPANLIADIATGSAWLTGFGLTSRLPRQRQPPVPPEVIAGTLAYMSPEQTGRMNRSVDSRSDLYSLGITLYEVLTGGLPFTAGAPMEWVHCHTARQPPSPSERFANIPATVSAIILKLLAKTADERYQSAAGAERDLRRCLLEWDAAGRIGGFALGQHDNPDRLLIPEKLYGREREVGTLLSAFDRVVAGGRSELVLVCGHPGIGKSAVVNELHKALVPPRALFASGKFDQYKRDIPYATLAQAFQSLIRPLLSKSEGELREWRQALRHALDPHGILIADLVPELKFIIGEQPPVADLPPQETQRRFQHVFRQFIGVFARPEHPLALFLDDLQWLDAGTLELLEDLLSQTDVRHLLLIGAYRDNEVDAAHPLTRRLETMREAGSILNETVLHPLSEGDIGQLLADALRCELHHTAPLAQLVHEKTSGNPFFAIQFIETLKDESLLAFDYAMARWSWNLDLIRAKGYTDNIVELMVDKLSRLPRATREALQQLACVGSSAEFETLQMVYQNPDEQWHGELWEATKIGLVIQAENSYRFLHDRVQEAAYSLIPDEARARAHLRIGRLLAECTPPEQRNDAIFEIVNQLNRGAALMVSRSELEQLAELNLAAGKRAKSSTAYASALKYLNLGAKVLSEREDAWARRHDLVFQIELHRAECEFLVGESEAAAQRLAALASRAANLDEVTKITCLRADVFTTLNRSDLAIAVCLDCLRDLGVDWSPQPTKEEARAEYDRLRAFIGHREVGQLIELPTMSDQTSLAMLEVIAKALPAAMFTDENLHSALICSAVSLSLRHGNGDASCSAYVWLGVIARHRFGDSEAGFQFGHLGYQLVERRGLTRFQAQVCLIFGQMVKPWTHHLRTCEDLLRRGFDTARKLGELTYAGYCCNSLITNLLAAGVPLSEVQREAESSLEFVWQARFGLVADIIRSQLALIQTLRGFKPTFGRFNDEEFDELAFESHLASEPSLAIAECWYWVRKLQARFFAGECLTAVVALRNAERLLWTSPGMVEGAEAHFYGALSLAACCDTASPDPSQLDSLRRHSSVIKASAEKCPDNFESRAALIEAEVARLEGRVLDAEHLYEQAIRSAHAHNFVQNEAIANELAARFYRTRGFATTADAYMRNALTCYDQWGATGKVKQLDVCFPHLRQPQAPSAVGAAIETPLAWLDAETVIEASQTLSSEINSTRLMEKLMRLAIKHAGAQRGLLILLQGAVPYAEGEATFEGETIDIALRHAPVQSGDLLQAALQYALRTGERVLLDDASSDPTHSGDDYVRRRGVRSVLCVPVIKQTRVIGALYLENNLTTHVFTPGRVAVLEVLASQAAISLENARLYEALERENQDRKRAEDDLQMIVDTIPGLVVILSGSGAVDFENSRTRQYLGPTKSNTGEWASNGIVHPDDLPRVLPIFADGVASGTPFEYDVRLRHESGSYRWFQLRAHPVRAADGGVARWYVLFSDIDEKRRTEEALRGSEREFRLIVHSVAGMIAVFSPAGELNGGNQQLLDYFEQPLEEVGRWATNGMTHPDDLQHCIDSFTRSIQSGEPYDFETRFKRVDGVYRWFQIRGHPLRDAEGTIVRWYGLLTDIDDRKRAEEQLAASERRLRLAINALPAPAWSTRPDGYCDFLSHRWFEYTGFLQEQALGWGWRDALHPDDAPSLVGKWQVALASGMPIVAEARMRRFDGQYRWFLFQESPVRDESGTIFRWYGACLDIEDHKRAEAALRRSETFLAEGQRISSTGSFSWRLADDELTFSAELSRIFDFEPQEVVTFDRIRDRVHPEDLPSLAEKMGEVRSGRDNPEYEIRLRMPDHTNKHVRVFGRVIRHQDGSLECLGAVQDVTQRRVAEDALARVRSELAHVTRLMSFGALTASIAHEVNQPLQGIITNASACVRMLDSSPPNVQGAIETARRTIRDGNRASEVVARLRKLFSKANGRSERVDLNEAAAEVVALLASDLQRHRVIVETDFAESLPTIAADRVQLQQVILNLLTNASEAMSTTQDRQRVVVIGTARDGDDRVRLSVRDAGVGLGIDDVEKLFRPFFTTKDSGMGIGLSVSRSIIESHNGRLWVEPNTDVGVTFIFAIPVTDSKTGARA